jgi:hypothetical protein
VDIKELAAHFEIQTRNQILLRANRAIEHLLGAIQEAYYAVMIGSRGAAGSVASLVTSIKEAQGFIEAFIGFGKTGDYLKFVEFGVKPASGAKYDAYSKLPPVAVFAEWIRRARLSIPSKFKPLGLRAKERITSLKRLAKRTGDSRVKVRTRSAITKITAHTTKKAKATGDLDEKARIRFAWAMVIKRKRFGYRGLRIIERTAKAQEANIRQILESE